MRLYLCEKKTHLPEHDGATGYDYYVPVEAVDVAALKSEIYHKHATVMDNHTAQTISMVIEYLSTHGLLRTNEIEPEGRG